jgi:hypothetical protein
MKQTYLFCLLFVSLFSSAQIINIPDANFKAKLLATSPSNSIAKDLTGNYFKIDTNNDGEIQQSEANEVSELNLSTLVNGNFYFITSAVGITNFNNLTSLNVSENKIVNLNITGMQYLKFINCSGNSQYLISMTIENLPLLETLNCQSAGSNTSNPFYSLLNLPSIKTINFNSCRFYNNTLSNLVSLEHIYGNAGLKSNVISLDLSNNPNLKTVELNDNQLSNLSLPLNNIIETFKVFGNDLTTFDKSIFTNLKTLDLGWNKLSSIDVSNITTLINLYCDKASTHFNYDLTSLNVQGCTNLVNLICSRNLLTNLNLQDLTYLYILDCYGNYDTLSNSGLQTINLKNCISLKKIIANGNNLLTELDLSCSSNYSEIRVQQCTNLQKINLKNGENEGAMNPGTFSYYSCPNLNLVGVDFNENLTFLSTTIQQSPYYNFTPNCTYNTIIGNVKHDIEGDGCQNNIGIEGIKINYNSTIPDSFTFSNSQGNFILYTKNSSINITPESNIYPLFDFGLTEPLIVNFNSGNILEYVNFCLTPSGIHHDVEISIIPIEVARPGFDAFYKIIYKNKGNQVENGTINLQFNDAILDVVSTNPALTTQIINNLSFNYSNLNPFETREISVVLNVNSPMETPAVNSGDILNYTVTNTITNTDEMLSDNTFVLNQTVVNSYDPNDKTCLQGNYVGPDKIGNYVHYMIRFENTGTFPAENIVVKDMIDTTKFDISSLIPLNASHNYFTKIAGNKVEFIFENINLPFNDATNDGYVAFKIKTLPSLVVGNTFSNSANIYFDYNFPIITNTATTTIAALNNPSFEFANHFSLYPNPTTNELNINLKSAIEINSIQIYNTIGQLVTVQTGNALKVDVSNLKSGNYFIKINTNEGFSTSQFIKE